MRDLKRRLKQLELIVGVNRKKTVIRFVSVSPQSEREKYQKENPELIRCGEEIIHGRKYDQWRNPNWKDMVVG